MLGNIKFIGELGKLEMLSENVLHQCIQQLMPRKSAVTAEELECLCQIMRTCGGILDHDKGQRLMQQYFERMTLYVNDLDLPQRIRFMIQDVIELRLLNWTPRQAIVPEGPAPIRQLSEDDIIRASNGFSGGQSSHNRTVGNNVLDSTTDMFRRSFKIRNNSMDSTANKLVKNVFICQNIQKIKNSNSGTNGTSVNHAGNNSQQTTTASLMDTKGTVISPTSKSDTGIYRSTWIDYSATNFANFTNGNNSMISKEIIETSSIKEDDNLPNLSLQHSLNNNYIPLETPPRFRKLKSQISPCVNEVSLRHAANSKNSSNVVAVEQQSENINDDSSSSSVVKFPNIQTCRNTVNDDIDTINNEQEKTCKKDKCLSKKEAVKRIINLIDSLSSKNPSAAAAIYNFRKIKINERDMTDILVTMVTHVLSSKQENKLKLVLRLICSVKEDGVVTPLNIADCFRILLDTVNNGQMKLKDLAEFAGHMMMEQIIPICDIAQTANDGMHYPLLLLVLQYSCTSYEKESVYKMMRENKIDLLKTLPPKEQSKKNLYDVLQSYDLFFLNPLLAVEGKLKKEMKHSVDGSSLLNWIKSNIDSSLYSDVEFISMLITILVDTITEKTSSEIDDKDRLSEKKLKEMDRSHIEKYKSVLRTFVCKEPTIQLTAIYAIQACCSSLEFPKGMLLRWFINMYEMELIEEDTFLKWKEDVNDNYPGKGKALFQVNTWLSWLAESDEEEDE